MNIVEEIANYLDGKNVGNVGEDIFIGMLRDDDEALLLVGAGSGNQEKYMEIYEQTIEIWSRSKSPANSFNKLQEAFNELHRLANVQTTNSYIYFAYSLDGLVDVGRDANNRSLYRTTIQVIYRDKTIS